MIWNEDGEERELRKESLEDRTRVRNKIKLRNQEVRPANSCQSKSQAWGQTNGKWNRGGTRKGKTE